MAGTATLNSSLGALGLVFTTTSYTVGGTTNMLSVGTGGITGSTLTTGTTIISSPLALVGSQTWNFGAGATLSTGAVNLGTSTLTVNGTGNTNITDVLSGTGTVGFVKTGTGTLTLSGANTFNGGITFNGGTASNAVNNGNIRLANSAALGTGTKSINTLNSTNGGIGAIELIGGVSIPSTISFNVGGRTIGPTFAFLRNVSGNNTFAGGIGGGGYTLESQAGLLTLSGGLRNNVAGGTRIRPLRQRWQHRGIRGDL